MFRLNTQRLSRAGDQDALGGEDLPEVRIKISAADGSFNGSTNENIFLRP